ncbi:unnamed protein product [Larinioides sclopetarius]|uniref:Uncharacterized protein n=1 Tax=Larinioides sclopetarius TaxID=280406 RepID=A0AAV1ZDE6_9ARAC
MNIYFAGIKALCIIPVGGHQVTMYDLTCSRLCGRRKFSGVKFRVCNPQTAKGLTHYH